MKLSRKRLEMDVGWEFQRTLSHILTIPIQPPLILLLNSLIGTTVLIEVNPKVWTINFRVHFNFETPSMKRFPKASYMNKPLPMLSVLSCRSVSIPSLPVPSSHELWKPDLWRRTGRTTNGNFRRRCLPICAGASTAEIDRNTLKWRKNPFGNTAVRDSSPMPN